MNEEQLLNAVLESDDFNEIVDACSKFLNNPIVVINRDYDVGSYSRTLQPDDESWILSVTRGFVTMEFSHNLAQWSSLKQYDAPTDSLIFTEISQYRRKFYRLTFKGHFLGFLNITESHAAYNSKEEHDYSLVRAIIAKEMFHQSQNYHESRSPESQFLFACCEDLYTNTEQLWRHFNLTNLINYHDFRLILIDLDHLESYNANRDTLKDDITALFQLSASIIHDDYLVVLCLDSELQTRLESFRRYLEAHHYQAYLSVVISTPEHFTATYTQTKHAKRLCHMINNDQALVFYRDLMIVDLFDKTSNYLDLTQYILPIFIEIQAYDHDNDTQYLQTLFHYYNTNHSIQQTAALMYVHRNTIGYRLNKIQDLFDLDLNDHKLGHDGITSVVMLNILASKNNDGSLT